MAADVAAEDNTVKYVVDSLIGHGSFGMVYLVKSGATGEVFALKRILYDNSFKSRELQIVRAVQHKNIVALRHSFYSDDLANRNDAKEGEPPRLFLNLVFDYYPDNLQRFIRHFTQQREVLPILYVRLIVYQIAHALAKLHSPSVQVVHRDIKPANILLDSTTMHVALCDFGHAKSFATPAPSSTYIASRYYRAPELVLGNAHYTEAVDMWALGCILAELLVGSPVLMGDSSVGQLVEIVRLIGTPTAADMAAVAPTAPPVPLPQLARTPLAAVLRPGTDPLAIELVEKLLVYDPAQRATALDVVSDPFFEPLFGPTVRLANGRTFQADLLDVSLDDLEGVRVYVYL